MKALCAKKSVTGDISNKIFPLVCFVIPKLWLQPTKEKRLWVPYVLSLESRPPSGKPAPPLGLQRTTQNNPQDRRSLEEGSERSHFLGVLSVVGAGGGGWGRCMGEGIPLFPGWVSALPCHLLTRSSLCDRGRRLGGSHWYPLDVPVLGYIEDVTCPGVLT